MKPSTFAQTPRPPYYAVIFSSQRRGTDDDGYEELADRMAELAAIQPGYLGVESTRDAAGFGITVSYWQDEGSILAWRNQVEHVAARERGRSTWYSHFDIRVARVERAYGAAPTDRSTDP